MKAISYLRLSSKDQSTYSEDGQRRAVSDYCKANNLELVAEFFDNGESSYTFDRADFVKLEAYIKKHRPQYVIVYHLDRFSRNLAEALMKIKELRKAYNVGIRDISEPLNLDEEDPNVFMMRSFRFMMAENELHRIRKRTKDGMRSGRMQGRHLGKAPYGYRNEQDSQGKPIIVPEPQKAAVVQTIFRQFLAGHSIETVNRLAQKIGYTQRGKSAIQRILSNRIYIGEVKIGEGQYIKGIHDPIVDDFDFWQAQKLMGGRVKITEQPKEEVFLRGVLHDHKGKLMTAGNSRGKSGQYYWYYVSKVNRTSYPAKKLHGKFFEILDLMKLSETEAAELRERVTEMIKAKEKVQKETVKNLSVQLDQVRRSIAAAEEKYLMNPEISVAAYNKSVTQLRAKESALINELMAVEKPAAQLYAKLDQLLPMLGDIRAVFEKMPLDRQQHFIRAVFDNSLSYYDDTYRTPFVHPLFASKLNALKENRLLIVQKPVVNFGIIPVSTPGGAIVEHPAEEQDEITTIFKILVA